MYWNDIQQIIDLAADKLNSNIRCIEMSYTDYICEDVYKLNSNIRCIEIATLQANPVHGSTLNSNIRCIEIMFEDLDCLFYQSWIVTLDVLK